MITKGKYIQTDKGGKVDEPIFKKREKRKRALAVQRIFKIASNELYFCKLYWIQEISRYNISKREFPFYIRLVRSIIRLCLLYRFILYACYDIVCTSLFVQCTSVCISSPIPALRFCTMFTTTYSETFTDSDSVCLTCPRFPFCLKGEVTLIHGRVRYLIPLLVFWWHFARIF